jgi:indolepyruvate ferredoxin oxidoreductase alpha subunit
MSAQQSSPNVSTELVLLGDEAVALGAAHAGLSAAYAYPGTPSTEIMEFLREYSAREGRPLAKWCANEKTAYEAALGASMAGKRTLVSMKHVGLNVAADPFVNSAIVSVDGGLVLAVADDPGQHSSQNEQDSRYLADFARTVCLEPADQQQAYDMARDAFDISERFQIPVMLRLVTRLAHSRAPIRTTDPRDENALNTNPDKNRWILLPSFSRKLWRRLLDQQAEMRAFSESSPYNTLELNPHDNELGVITTGIARNYYLEDLPALESPPSHLHIGVYPFPVEKIRTLANHVQRILIIEEGYPFVERYLRGILPQALEIQGKESGHLPLHGELNPDVVRKALGLTPAEGMQLEHLSLPNRPPRLCQGCPHGDAYNALNEALAEHDPHLVTSDIGCYTLGALPPYNAGESCVCMGASIGMAKGAADAGFRPAVAVIGDSTFLHSGVTPLMDAVADDSDMTVLILDNQTVAMTGTQPTVLPSERLVQVVLGLGVDPAHCRVHESHPKRANELVQIFRDELAHQGLSVVITYRECLEKARKNKSAKG